MLIQKYTEEQEDINQKIKRLEQKIHNEKQNNEVVKYANYIVNALEDFLFEKELTAQILHRLIKRIDVHAESINKCVWKRKYDIDITFAYCDDMIKEFLKLSRLKE